MAKATAVKVRNLWDQGKLNFVLDGTTEIQTMAVASKDADLAGGPPATFSTGWDRLSEIQSEMPVLDWTIEVLERAGFEPKEGLDMITQFDDFLWRETADGRRSQSELVKFVELHYVFSYALANTVRKYPAPLEWIRFAARSSATGLVDNNQYMKKVAIDVLRYQAWRGRMFLRAFEAAQAPISRAAKRRNQHTIDELDAMLSSHPMEGGTETPGEGIGDV